MPSATESWDQMRTEHWDWTNKSHWILVRADSMDQIRGQGGLARMGER